MAGKGGAEGEFGEGLPGLCGAYGNNHLVQVSRKGSDGKGRQLTGGGGQPEKVWEYLDADDKDPGTGGGGPKSIRVVFKAVIQAVLFLGSEMWVLTPCMERYLGSFQHRFA